MLSQQGEKPTFDSLQKHFLAPHQMYAQLRDAAPLYFDRQSRCWLVTGHEAATAILRDPRFESSQEGVSPHASLQSSQEEMPPVSSLLRQQLLFYTGEAHRRAYAVVQGAVSALEKDEGMRRFISDTVREVLSAALARGEMDVVRDLAAPISGRVSARFVGLPADDPAQLAQWVDWSNAFGDRTSGYGRSSSEPIYRMQLLFLSIIGARRGQQRPEASPARATAPLRDLLSALLASPECFPGDQMVASNLQMLFSAGRITCEKAISEGVLLLVQHGLWPQLRAAILDDRTGTVCRRLADEWQRYVTPTRYLARWAREDVHLDAFEGTPLIRRGHKVIIYLEAANRDPNAFAEPQRFDPQRHPNRHISFGFGPHTCPGAGLARLELPVVLAELARRVRRLELKAGTQIVYRSNPNLGGVESYTVLVS